jgi:mono/diheme cytochrome c family protein
MRHRRALAAAVLAAAWFAPPAVEAADAATVKYFQETCAICHGEKGEGIAGLAPALKGNKFVSAGKPEDIGATITNGRQGDQKRYKDYPSPMPAQPLGDKKLQALIEYLRGDLQK